VILRQEEPDPEVALVDHPGAPGEAPKHRDAVCPTPFEIHLFRFLGIAQDDDWPCPISQEQRDPPIGRPIHEPRLARQVLDRRSGRTVHLEENRPIHHRD
jgi:hypothetical protein